MINYWRSAAGLQPVSDAPAWDQGIENHLTYLALTPAAYETGQYASAHTENPASPYYTASGALEGGSSDLLFSSLDAGDDSPDSVDAVDAINSWLAAPFHAIGMLRSQLQAVAFADDPQYGSAGLDVLRGLDWALPAATKPVVFPGAGSTTSLTTYAGDEYPDPTETCGWQGDTVGLPLIVMLPQTPAADISATLTGPAGTQSTANGELCVVDQHTYHSTDPVYGSAGLDLLEDSDAVLLIPSTPLAYGNYSVSVEQPGCQAISWSFAAAATTDYTDLSFNGGVSGGCTSNASPPSTSSPKTSTSQRSPRLKLVSLVRHRGVWSLTVSHQPLATGQIVVYAAPIRDQRRGAFKRICQSSMSDAEFALALSAGRWQLRVDFLGTHGWHSAALTRAVRG